MIMHSNLTLSFLSQIMHNFMLKGLKFICKGRFIKTYLQFLKILCIMTPMWLLFSPSSSNSQYLWVPCVGRSLHFWYVLQLTSCIMISCRWSITKSAFSNNIYLGIYYVQCNTFCTYGHQRPKCSILCLFN